MGERLQHRLSSLETPERNQEWGYAPLNTQWVIGVSPRGEPWVVAEAAGKGFRRPLGSSKWQPLDFAAHAFKPAPYPENADKGLAKELAEAYLATGVFFFADGRAVVASASAARADSRIVVFSPQGHAVAQQTLAGRVVGIWNESLVVARTGKSCTLAFYRLKGKS